MSIPPAVSTPQVLAGKNAIVTGASRGIGRAIAIALAEAGANVGINFRSHPEEAEEVAGVIRQLGREALPLQADVADRDAMVAIIDQAAKHFGQLDIAVSNAAYSDRELFYEADLEGFERTVNVTMWGAFNLLWGASRRMIAQGQGGSIVMISSPHAFVPAPRAMAYNLSKAANDQMARTAALELVDHRIRVNMVHPGWIDTPGERKFASEEDLERGGAKLPWGRMGRPEEVARGVIFLCDPASEYMTGSSILIDGGITLPWWANRGSAVPD